MESNFFVFHITIILVAGLIAGWICKKFKASALIGYLVVGTIIGPGGLDLTGSKDLERALESAEAESVRLENAPRPETPPFEPESPVDEFGVEGAAVVEGVEFATAKDAESLKEAIQNDRFAFEATTEFGVLLLLFAIGIEFTFDKLTATARYMFLGGSIQMGLTIILSLFIVHFFGLTWTAGLVLGCVVSLSSTALVYRSMQDAGQADSKRAQATLGLLIFQDLALVPMLLLLPRLFGSESGDPSDYWFGNSWLDMGSKSAIFCALVVFSKILNAKYLTPKLAALHSNDLVILFAIVVLLGMCAAAQALGLTPALGALAAGVALGENRLTRQIDALVLPFREAFSAIFFISLGMLMDFSFVCERPVLCIFSLIAAISLKWLCSATALRVCGMDWRGAAAYGLSISQVGELAFMLMTVAYAAGALPETAYQTTLFVSVASLVITPNMVNLSLTKLFGMKPEPRESVKADSAISPELRAAINSKNGHSIIVGVGHIGGQLAEELTRRGKSVCLVDFNPVNLHPFAQLGLETVAGDGADEDVLQAAGIGRAELILVTVPRDDLALNVVRACRQLNPTAVILSRSRYRLNIQPLKRAGAETVLCEENNICDALVKMIADHYANAEPSASGV